MWEAQLLGSPNLIPSLARKLAHRFPSAADLASIARLRSLVEAQHERVPFLASKTPRFVLG